VAVEPVALAASTDGKILYVVNATSLTNSDFGTLMAIDTAECGSCHNGEAFTDNSFADVGTYVQTGPVRDNLISFLHRGGMNTPSLLGLARSAPYLHDGSALTLKDCILTGKSGDMHGKTSRLSNTEVDELVSYIKGLDN